MRNPYQAPRSELKDLGFDWEISDRLLIEAGLKPKRAAPLGCRLLRHLAISHRPTVYQSGRGICLTALCVGLLTLFLGGLLHHWLDAITWREALRASSYGSIGGVIGASIGVSLHHRSTRKRHQLPPWPEFLRRVENASQKKEP